MSKMNYLNSIEAANLLGINVSTIKRWTDSGKLNCIQSAGGHRKFLMKHINEYLKKHSNEGKKITVLPYDTSEHRQLNHLIQKHDIIGLKEHLLRYSFNSSHEEVSMIISGLALAQYPIYKIFDELVTPVLHKIGDLWEDRKISIVEEHFASNIIRDSLITLREIIIKIEDKSQKVFCLAFDDEQHDIPLKMVQILLEQRGFDVFYCGQRTPIESLEKLIAQNKPERIYVSCTYFDENWSDEKVKSRYDEINDLYVLSDKYGFDLYIGGQAFDKLLYNENKVKRRLSTFKEVYNN
jgi:excisionase family DNA binding protein